MKEGWEVKNLGNVCQIIGGGTPSKKVSDYYDGNIPWATVRDMNCDFLSHTELKITQEGLKNSSSNLIEKGEVIIATRVGLGKVCILNQATAINQDLKGIIPKKTNLNREFLFYWYKSLSEKVQNDGVGMTVKGVNLNYVRALQIPIPPLPEQKQIVAILDKAFAAIDQAQANIEKNIENAKDLFQSKLNEIFSQKGEGWEENTLGEVCYLKSGGTPSRSKKEYWENGLIPWYSSGELNQTYTEAPERHITELGLEKSNAKIFPEGSLLIGMYDTAALKMSIIDRDATFNQAIVGVEPNENVNLLFIMHSINSQKARILSLRRGVRQKNLNQTKIKAIRIRLPEKSIQNQIVSELEGIKNKQLEIESHYQQKLANLEELKKSILQKAFSGELTQKPVAL